MFLLRITTNFNALTPHLQDLSDLETRCLKKLDSMRGDVTKEALQNLLEEYRTEQLKLINTRQSERDRQTTLLHRRLEQRNRLMKVCRNIWVLF